MKDENTGGAPAGGASPDRMNAHRAALKEAMAPLSLTTPGQDVTLITPADVTLRPGPTVVTIGHTIAHALLTHYRERTVSLPMLLALLPDAAATRAAFASAVPQLTPALTTTLFARAVRESNLTDPTTLEERLRTAAATFNLDQGQIDALINVAREQADELRRKADGRTLGRFLSGPIDAQDVAGALSRPLLVRWGDFSEAYTTLQNYIGAFRNRVDAVTLRDPFITLESSELFSSLLAIKVSLDSYPLARWHYNMYQLMHAQEELQGGNEVYSLPRVRPLFHGYVGDTVLDGMDGAHLSQYEGLFGADALTDLRLNADLGQFKYHTVDVPKELRDIYLEDIIETVLAHDTALFAMRQGSIDVLDGLQWAVRRANAVVYPAYPVQGRSLWNESWVQTLLASHLLHHVANPSSAHSQLLSTLLTEASTYLGTKIENQAISQTVNMYLTVTLAIIEAFHSVRNMLMDILTNASAYDLRVRESQDADTTLDMHHPDLVQNWLNYYRRALDELALVDEAPTSASSLFSVQRVESIPAAVNIREKLTFAVVPEPMYARPTNSVGRISIKDVPVERSPSGHATVRLSGARNLTGSVVPRSVRTTLADIAAGSLVIRAVPITVETPQLPYDELKNLIRLIPNRVAQALARFGTVHNLSTNEMHPAWVVTTLLERFPITTVNTLQLDSLKASILGLGTGVWTEIDAEEEGVISRVIRQRAFPSLARLTSQNLPSDVVSHSSASIYHDTGSANLVFIWPTVDYTALREQAPHLVEPLSLPTPVFGVKEIEALKTIPIKDILERSVPEKHVLDRLTFQVSGASVALRASEVKPEDEFKLRGNPDIPVVQPIETVGVDLSRVASDNAETED